MKINEEVKEGCSLIIVIISVLGLFMLFALIVEGLFDVIIEVVQDYWYIVIIALIGAYLMCKENSK